MTSFGDNSSESPPSVGSADLADLIARALASPRKRAHLVLHAGPGDSVQRLVIAAQPGAYIRPHRHSEQWELLMVMRGRIDVLLFDDSGKTTDVLSVNRTSPIVQIACGRWHSAIVQEPHTVVLEVKPGPYRDNEFAEWAPAEGSDGVAAFLANLQLAPQTDSSA